MTLVTGPGQGNAKCDLEKILRRKPAVNNNEVAANDVGEYERGEGDYIKEDEDERGEHVREGGREGSGRGQEVRVHQGGRGRERGACEGG